MTTQMLWVPTSKNTKTGNIPQGYVGQTRELTQESCCGCPLKKKCYYWSGSAQMGHGAMRRGLANGKDYSYTHAIQNAAKTAQYVRAAVGGDPNVFSRAQIEAWRNEALTAGFKGLLIYTHFPDTKASHLKGLAMASCDDMTEVDRLIEKGWRVALTLPYRTDTTKKHKHLPIYEGQELFTPAGHRIVVCPAQTHDNITCNDCGLCDPTKDAAPVIGFLMH